MEHSGSIRRTRYHSTEVKNITKMRGRIQSRSVVLVKKTKLLYGVLRMAKMFYTLKNYKFEHKTK